MRSGSDWIQGENLGSNLTQSERGKKIEKIRKFSPQHTFPGKKKLDKSVFAIKPRAKRGHQNRDGKGNKKGSRIFGGMTEKIGGGGTAYAPFCV